MMATWAGAGDEVVRVDLDALYRSQHLPMTRLAHAIVGSNAVAEELVHDAFVRLGRTRPERVDDPVAYLRVIVVNLSRSWVRRQVVGRRVHEQVGGRAAPAAFEPAVDETWAALQRLPVKYRAALALRYYDDLPDDQIAIALDCRPATVRSLVHRGLDLLRKELT
jgi:RNA polymerase sigma factor (sigma-70 family)